MGCALNACYSTAPSTYTVTQTVVTTTNGQPVTTTQTATTIATPTAPAGLPASDTNVAAKFIPTAVAKVASSAAGSTDNSGGLSSAEIGGIVGGAVAFLLIVITCAVLIIRYLHRVVDAVESRKDTSSGPQARSQAQMAQHYGTKLRPSPSEVDAMSYDPLMMSNTPGSGSTPGGRHRSDSEFSTPHSNIPSGDLAALRHTSFESAPNSYFDIPARVHNMPGRHAASLAGAASGNRVSTDSQGTQYSATYAAYQQQQQQQHGRHFSNGSEMSAGSSDHGGINSAVGSPFVPAELDPTGILGELPGEQNQVGGGSGRRSRASSGLASPRPSLGGIRRRSDPPQSGATVQSATPTRSSHDGLLAGVGLGFTGGGQPLDVVNETTEIMHGYYGPRNQTAGQTAAGLDVTHDLSSPVAPPWQSNEPGTNG
jgi:hypothetical protein